MNTWVVPINKSYRCSGGSFAKEACNFKEPTNRSHPICRCAHLSLSCAEYPLFYRALLQKRPII